MSDVPSSFVPTAAAPDGINGGVELTALGHYNFLGDLHANDAIPASIVAGRDIDGSKLYIPKAAQIFAGRDIVDLYYQGQNLQSSDVTLIDAGRDFTDPPTFASNGSAATPNVVINVGGPGSLDILAGRNINLGFSIGVTTSGNLYNPTLPAAGADITMMAGLGQSPDYSGFLQKIIEPSASHQQQLVSYVESLTGASNLTVQQGDAAFAAFSAAEQGPLIDSVFFNELNLSGIEANQTHGPGYARGYAAIDALFPGTPTVTTATGNTGYSGDLDLTYSQIYTLSGGGINLLAPGGSINAGLANAAAAGANRPPNQLGIVTQGAGDLSVYARGDVNVNSSRMFTLGGGNILIWSQLGSIDAGNGAKSSLSLPPPTYTTDQFGNVVLVFDAAVAGSGIRTIQSNPNVPAGNVDLIAPIGTVNAGDAGIGAAGDINIAAVSVVGASNINFGGTATGVPAAVSGLTASVSSAASAASSATTSVAAADEANAGKAEQAPLAQAALSWLDVFVTGLGEENCKPEDLECLKRQKRN
jgi:hypothetical protein